MIGEIPEGYGIEVVIKDSPVYKVQIYHGIFEKGDLVKGQLIKIPGPLSLAPTMTDEEITVHDIVKDISTSSYYGSKN